MNRRFTFSKEVEFSTGDELKVYDLDESELDYKIDDIELYSGTLYVYLRT